MKKSLLNPAKSGLLIVSFLLVCGIAYGQTFTAVASGDWSNTATWSGGTIPPTTIGAGQEVIIGATFTVTMDNDVTLNGNLSEIDVEGTLTAVPHITLNVTSGAITGSGSINTATIMLGVLGSLTFTGSITADTLMNSIISLGSSAQITVNEALILPAFLNVNAGSSLMLGANSTIVLSGGGVTLSTGGTLNLTSNYNVDYTTLSTTSGLELSGSGLGNVTINVGNSNSITLSSNLVMTDSLKFISGTLILNGYNLTANGEISGDIMIAGNAASNLTINTSGGLASSIMFSAGFQNLDDLTINVGSGNSVIISSNLTVSGNLAISGSSNLNVSGVTLTLAGNMTGTGNLVVNGNTNLDITASNSIYGNINLSGTALGNFLLNIGSGNSAMLGTALNVDTLDLMSGALVLGGNNLIINASITGGGTGAILSTPSSNVTVTAAASVAGPLVFLTSSDTINNLTVNIGSGGSLMLGSNLVINGTLDFMNGYVNLAGNALNIGAAGSISGASSTAYIITEGGGYLTMYANVGSTTTFAVGNIANYLPAEITLNSGSSSGTVGVNVSSGVYSQGTAGIMISATQPMVDATWLFQNNIGTGLNTNMNLYWMASAEVNGFVHSNDYISHYVSAWDDIGDSMTAMASGSLYFVTRTNITSMSPFAVFDQQTIPTGINNIVVGSVGFEIYPNPAYDNLYIKNTTGNTDAIYVEIYNTLGQVVSRFQFKDAVFAVPVNELATGTYFIKFYTNNTAVVKKFVKL
jgi:fibronectin-binding autotransporter adhesin